MLRRDLALVALGALVCPPLASFVFLLTTALVRHGLPGLQSFDVAFVVATIPFSYPLAIVPSLIAAAGNALVGRWAPAQLPRLVLSLPIGAIPFMLSLSWMAEDDATGTMQIGDIAGLGIAGAVVSLVTVAVVESFGTTQ